MHCYVYQCRCLGTFLGKTLFGATYPAVELLDVVHVGDAGAGHDHVLGQFDHGGGEDGAV